MERMRGAQAVSMEPEAKPWPERLFGANAGVTDPCTGSHSAKPIV